MSKADPYFQFPLCALAFGSDTTSRLNHIIAYGLATAGEKRWRAMGAADRIRLLEGASEPRSKGCDWRITAHSWLYAGAKLLNVTIGSYPNIWEQHGAISEFIGDFESRHGRDPYVRIRTDLVFESRNGNMSYREFCVLCAIYCAIGAKKGAVRITREMIRTRALGYRSPKIMTAEWARMRHTPPEPLTDSQIRTTVDRLHERNFFARCHLGGKSRQTFFSHRMDNDELRAAVFKRKTYRATFKAQQASRNAETAAMIQKHKSELAQQMARLQSPTSSSAEPASGTPSGSQADARTLPQASPEDRQYDKSPGVETRTKEVCVKKLPQFEEGERHTPLPRATQEQEPERAPADVDAVKTFAIGLFPGANAVVAELAVTYWESKQWLKARRGWKMNAAAWFGTAIQRATREEARAQLGQKSVES